MAPPKEIDWTKPLRLRLDIPGCGVEYKDVELLHVYNGRGFVTWGSKSSAHGVGPFGQFDNASINGRVENVPEKRDPLCIGLIKATAGCAGDLNLWFVATNHLCDKSGELCEEGDTDLLYVKPLPRSEVEAFLWGLEPCVIVEVDDVA